MSPDTPVFSTNKPTNQLKLVATLFTTCIYDYVELQCQPSQGFT